MHPVLAASRPCCTHARPVRFSPGGQLCSPQTCCWGWTLNLCVSSLSLEGKVLTPVSIPSLHRNSRIYSPGGGTDGRIFPLYSSLGRWQGRLQSAVLSLAETSGVAEGVEEAEGAGKGAEPLPQHLHAATRAICSCSPLQARDQHIAEPFSPYF